MHKTTKKLLIPSSLTLSADRVVVFIYMIINNESGGFISAYFSLCGKPDDSDPIKSAVICFTALLTQALMHSPPPNIRKQIIVHFKYPGAEKWLVPV